MLLYHVENNSKLAVAVLGGSPDSVTCYLTCMHTPGPQQVWSRWGLQQNCRWCPWPWATIRVFAANVKSTDVTIPLLWHLIQAQADQQRARVRLCCYSCLPFLILPDTLHRSRVPLLPNPSPFPKPALGQVSQCSSSLTSVPEHFFLWRAIFCCSAGSFSLLLLDDLGVISYSAASPGVGPHSPLPLLTAPEWLPCPCRAVRARLSARFLTSSLLPALELLPWQLTCPIPLISTQSFLELRPPGHPYPPCQVMSCPLSK